MTSDELISLKRIYRLACAYMAETHVAIGADAKQLERELRTAIREHRELLVPQSVNLEPLAR